MSDDDPRFCLPLDGPYPSAGATSSLIRRFGWRALLWNGL